MKMFLISSLSRQGGGWLRTRYVGESLRDAGWEAEWMRPAERAFPKSVDCLFTLPRYVWSAFGVSADAVFANKPLPNALLASAVLQKKGAFTVLDLDDDDTAMAGSVFAPVVKFFAAPFIHRSDMITTHNSALADYLAEKYRLAREKIYLLAQGVSELFFSESIVPVAEEILLAWRRENRKIALFMANMNAASELSVILRAFREALNSGANARLLVVGGGIKLKEYQREAAGLGLGKEVYFTGPVEVERIPSYVSFADWCALYYPDTQYNRLRESMKLREYLALGKPVLCNSVGNLKQFAAYTYQSGNSAEEYIKAFVATLAGGNRLDGREEKGRAFVRENYKWRDIGAKFVSKRMALRRGGKAEAHDSCRRLPLHPHMFSIHKCFVQSGPLHSYSLECDWRVKRSACRRPPWKTAYPSRRNL